jgi:hypothetical protein
VSSSHKEEYKMKKTVFITGITLAIVLLAIGCSNPAGGPGGSGDSGGYLGTGPLTLKGRIYEQGIPAPPSYNLSYTLINKNGMLTASTGDAAVITNGSFDITVTPSSSLVSFSTVAGSFFSEWANVTSNNGSALFEMIDYLTTSGSPIGNGHLVRERFQTAVKGSGYTATGQQVRYLYVNADVTITGDDKTDSDGVMCKAFALNLKQGWNAVCGRSVITRNYLEVIQSGTLTLSISNPADLYWVFSDY